MNKQNHRGSKRTAVAAKTEVLDSKTQQKPTGVNRSASAIECSTPRDPDEVAKEKAMLRAVYSEARKKITGLKDHRGSMLCRVATVVIESVGDIQQRKKVLEALAQIKSENKVKQGEELSIGEWSEVGKSLIESLDAIFIGMKNTSDPNFAKVISKLLQDIIHNVQATDQQLENLDKLAYQFESGLTNLIQQLAENDFMIRDLLAQIAGDLDRMKAAIAKNLHGEAAEEVEAILDFLPMRRIRSCYQEIREEHSKTWQYIAPEHLRKDKKQKDEAWCWNCWTFSCSCSVAMKKSYQLVHQGENREENFGHETDLLLAVRGNAQGSSKGGVEVSGNVIALQGSTMEIDPSDKVYAQRLMDELCARTARIRGFTAPTAEILEDFCKKCEPLEGCHMSEAITEKLQKAEWQPKLVALYATDSLIEHKRNDVVGHLVGTSLKLIVEAQRMPECEQMASKVLAALGFDGAVQVSPTETDPRDTSIDSQGPFTGDAFKRMSLLGKIFDLKMRLKASVKKRESSGKNVNASVEKPSVPAQKDISQGLTPDDKEQDSLEGSANVSLAKASSPHEAALSPSSDDRSKQQKTETHAEHEVNGSGQRSVGEDVNGQSMSNPKNPDVGDSSFDRGTDHFPGSEDSELTGSSSKVSTVTLTLAGLEDGGQTRQNIVPGAAPFDIGSPTVQESIFKSARRTASSLSEMHFRPVKPRCPGGVGASMTSGSTSARRRRDGIIPLNDIMELERSAMSQTLPSECFEHKFVSKGQQPRKLVQIHTSRKLNIASLDL